MFKHHISLLYFVLTTARQDFLILSLTLSYFVCLTVLFPPIFLLRFSSLCAFVLLLAYFILHLCLSSCSVSPQS